MLYTYMNFVKIFIIIVNMYETLSKQIEFDLFGFYNVMKY